MTMNITQQGKRWGWFFLLLLFVWVFLVFLLRSSEEEHSGPCFSLTLDVFLSPTCSIPSRRLNSNVITKHRCSWVSQRQAFLRKGNGTRKQQIKEKVGARWQNFLICPLCPLCWATRKPSVLPCFTSVYLWVAFSVVFLSGKEKHFA